MASRKSRYTPSPDSPTPRPSSHTRFAAREAMSPGGRRSPCRLDTHTRPSLRSDSDMSVSLDWYSPLTGMHVGWICVKHGFAKYAPRLYARQMAVAFDPFAFVDR